MIDSMFGPKLTARLQQVCGHRILVFLKKAINDPGYAGPVFGVLGISMSRPDAIEHMPECGMLGEWRARRDSNSRPSGSKPDALSN